MCLLFKRKIYSFFRQYLDHIAEEINEKLQESGLVLIGELAKTFGFTTDFMLEVYTFF